MNIGDYVTVTKHMVANKDTRKERRPRKMIVEDIEPTPCIYLGSGQRWDGNMSFSNGEEGYSMYWENTRSYNVLMCQPLDSGGRYRKPLAATLDGVQA